MPRFAPYARWYTDPVPDDRSCPSAAHRAGPDDDRRSRVGHDHPHRSRRPRSRHAPRGNDRTDLTGFPCVRAANSRFHIDCAAWAQQTSSAFFRLTILYSPLATLHELALAESRRPGRRHRNTMPDGTARPRPATARVANADRIAGGPHRAALLSAPYRGTVVAATNRIAPCPASTPIVELATP